MVPSRGLLTQMMNLLGAYVSTQLSAPTWVVKMVSNNFTPGPNLVAGDVTVDTTWLNNASTLPTAVFNGTNPYNQNDRMMSFAAKAGNLSLSGTPRTIFGVIVQEQTGHTPVASALLPVAANINASSQLLDMPAFSFELPANAVR